MIYSFLVYVCTYVHTCTCRLLSFENGMLCIHVRTYIQVRIYYVTVLYRLYEDQQENVGWDLYNFPKEMDRQNVCTCTVYCTCIHNVHVYIHVHVHIHMYVWANYNQ